MLATALAAAIDATCARTSAAAGTRPAFAIARVYDGGAHPAWRPATAAVLRRIARDPDIYSDVARVRRASDGAVAVDVATRSLDYRADAGYCFRRDGTLARIVETSSGTGNADVETRWFAPGGALVASRSHLTPLYASRGARVDPALRPAKPDVYATVRALPFFALVRE